jgi:hypothetical protein
MQKHTQKGKSDGRQVHFYLAHFEFYFKGPFHFILDCCYYKLFSAVSLFKLLENLQKKAACIRKMLV